MQIKEKLHPFLLVALLCFLTGFADSPAHSAPSDYPHAFKALMEDYRARMRYLTTRPLPPKSAPKEQKRAAVAAQADDIAKAFTDLSSRLAALKPPANFRQVHTATLSWFQGDAAGNHRWAEALRHDDRKTRSCTSNK